MKIIDKINKEVENNNVYYSFEYFPPRTKMGEQNLYIKLDKMSSLEPLFIDITWGAGGSTSDLTLDICKNSQKFLCLETQMHLTCTNINEALVKKTLDEAKKHNIRNILALRGDPPHGQDWVVADSKFQYAVDLVKYIRKEYGDYFGISVAGYPEGHPDGNYKKDLKFLKMKVDAGADFVITQLFYDVDKFLNFVKDCRKEGITCPILPGILPIINYNNFRRMVGFCNINVPQQIWDDLKKIKDNDEAVAEYGIQVVTDMCKKILDNGSCGLHFYTLNREDTCKKILNNLNLLDNISNKRELPWKSRIDTNESTRPIFWANARKYYIDRTSDWDHFPNGRWGDANDPQFGDIMDYHLFGISSRSIKSKKKLWGEALNDIDDVLKIFVNFITGSINYIPWCDYKASETDNINNELLELNKEGYLTINSQPRVNGMPSDSKDGWGGAGGFLYQKEYFEFFCSKEDFEKLDLTDNNLSYCAINKSNEIITNCEDCTIAVTWGVFPNKEIIQPTIVDFNSFLIWKEDAFSLWLNEWGNIYEEQTKSYELLKHIHDNYYLVFVVDNDYINGNLLKKIKI
ncbi:methylenetetrahydrofolate reductase [Aureispira]|nr:methylenetetrahydrofolate reductase [Aureispira sp.]